MRLLSLVAAIIVGHHVNVYCVPPPQWHNHWGPYAGAAVKYSNEPYPRNVYLRNCKGTVRRETTPETVFAHELLHVLHWDWPHRRVYYNQWRFHFKVDKILKQEEK